jgi:hypothetical protein
MEPIQTMPRKEELLVSVANVTPLSPNVVPKPPEVIPPTPEPTPPPAPAPSPVQPEEVIVVERIKGGYSWTRQILLVVLVLLAIIIIFSLIYLNGKSIYQYGI